MTLSCKIIQGENRKVLLDLEDDVHLVYMDPPFNTGQTQERHGLWYEDSSNPNYLEWLWERILPCWHLLVPTGSLFVHLDAREVHHVKVMLDKRLGRDRFQNEIIWAYDYGGRSKTRWSAKHDTLLWYVRDPKTYTFRYEDIDRVPYMAPGLVGPEKAARGKTPTDTWWHTIVPTNGKEKTGYPTQKPLGLLTRVVRVHSNPGELILDPFAGSGTTGHAALLQGRNTILIDENPQAVEVMKTRLGAWEPDVTVVDSGLR